jgi:hypothetical protein
MEPTVTIPGPFASAKVEYGDLLFTHEMGSFKSATQDAHATCRKEGVNNAKVF